MTRRSYGARLSSSSAQIQSYRHSQDHHIPRNLLDDLPDELSAFAQVSLGSADSWLDDSGLGFL